MALDQREFLRLSRMSDEDIFLELGLSLPRPFGASEPTDEQVREEAMAFLDELRPPRGSKLCENEAVKFFIANPEAEVTMDVAGAVADALLHAVLHLPPVTISIAFSRYCLRRHCKSHRELKHK